MDVYACMYENQIRAVKGVSEFLRVPMQGLSINTKYRVSGNRIAICRTPIP